MRKIAKMNGTRVLLDTENDVRLFNGHENIGPRQNRWLELYAHRLKSAGPIGDDDPINPDDYVFYLLHVSQWQGERTYIQEVTFEEAQEFASENYSDASDIEVAAFERYGLLDDSSLE